MPQNASRLTGRHFLQIPGPTPMPDRIMRAMDMPLVDQRGPEFAKLGKRVLEGIKTIFKTAQPVIIYTATGTGAWEAALTNTLSPGDRIQLENFDFGRSQLGNFAIYGIKTLWNPGSATVNPWSLFVRFRSALQALGGFIGGSGAYADVAAAFSGIQSLIAQDYQGRILGSIVAQLLTGKPGLLSAACQVKPADGSQAVVIAGGGDGSPS